MMQVLGLGLLGMSHKTPGYCWPTYFKVLEVLFLALVSQAFLPSKKACGTYKFRHLGIRQQYPFVFRDSVSKPSEKLTSPSEPMLANTNSLLQFIAKTTDVTSMSKMSRSSSDLSKIS